MDNIKCIEKYYRLIELFEKGYKGNPGYFAQKLNISRRTFFRLLKHIKETDNLEIEFDRKTQVYYLKSF
jgi:DNA-binding IclR family transcriptional regulator